MKQMIVSIVVHKEIFIIESMPETNEIFKSGEPTESELAGDYDDNVLNKEVRDNKEVIINNEKLNNKKWF